MSNATGASVTVDPDLDVTVEPDGDWEDPRTLRLSFSRVDTYEQCPLKFRFQYIDRLPRSPAPYLGFGNAIHGALERWWDSKLPEAPSERELLQALYDAWDPAAFDGLTRDEQVRWYRFAQQVLRDHHARFASNYRPAVAVEEWFELDCGDDVTVRGLIDHVARTDSGGLGVVDWKTNRKAKPRQQVAKSLQLAIYAWACRELFGQDPEWVALDFVVPGVRVTVPTGDLLTVDATRDRVRQVAAQIRAGRFDPHPNRLCGWCDFRAACPLFTGDGPDLPGLARLELDRLRRRQQSIADRIGELEALLGSDVMKA